MGIKKLESVFATRREVPIEIPEVCDEIVRLGIRDKIIICREPMNPAQCKGLYYRWEEHKAVYGDPEQVSLIVYTSEVDVSWQRVICCKELIHILDSPAELVRTDDEVDALLEKLVGPLSNDNFGFADFVASKDRLALYQSLPILFPAAARVDALNLIAQNRATVHSLASQLSLPEGFVRLVLSPDWPKIADGLVHC